MVKKLQLKDLTWEVYSISRAPYSTMNSSVDVWYNVEILVKWSKEPTTYRHQMTVKTSVGLELGCICIHEIGVDWNDYDLSVPLHVAGLIAKEIRRLGSITSPTSAGSISPLWQLLDLMKEGKREFLDKYKITITDIDRYWQQSIVNRMRVDAERLEKDLARNP